MTRACSLTILFLFPAAVMLGDEWISQSSGTTEHLRGVYSFDEANAVVAGTTEPSS